MSHAFFLYFSRFWHIDPKMKIAKINFSLQNPKICQEFIKLTYLSSLNSNSERKISKSKPCSLWLKKCSFKSNTLYHVLFSRILNKIFLESLRYTRLPCTVSFAVPFNFIRFLISALWCPFWFQKKKSYLRFYIVTSGICQRKHYYWFFW